MKKYIRLFFLIILIIWSGSCTEHFEELNSDPNNPIDAPAIHLFTQVIIQTVENEAGIGKPAIWSQQWSVHSYKSDDYYPVRIMTGSIDHFYITSLIDLEIIIRKTEDDIAQNKEINSNTSLLAAAKIMRVLNYHLVTDIFGDVPFSEALQGLDVNGILTPKFDTQESIYMDLLEELEEANTLLDLSYITNFGEGDLLFHGNPAKWKKFGNSLKLRILNRCAGTPWSFTYDMVDPQLDVTTAPGTAAFVSADSEIAAILNNPVDYPVLSGNEDNVQLFYPGLPYRQPIYNWLYSRRTFVISETMVDWLETRNDPRLPIFAQETQYYQNGSATDPYVGEQNGWGWHNDCGGMSSLGVRIAYDETAPLYILTYDEIEFIKAEYYMRQGNDALAKAAYEAGITASMERWDTLMGDYLSEPKVVWDSATYDGEKYQRIIEQKWAATYGHGWQAWHEVRRTGFPARVFEYEFKDTEFPDLGMPVRIRINEAEALLYAENFEEAQKRQNIEETNFGLFSTDGIKSQIWWHTRKNPIPTEIDPPGLGHTGIGR